MRKDKIKGSCLKASTFCQNNFLRVLIVAFDLDFEEKNIANSFLVYGVLKVSASKELDTPRPASLDEPSCMPFLKRQE